MVGIIHEPCARRGVYRGKLDLLILDGLKKHRHALASVITWVVLVVIYCATAIAVLQRLGIPSQFLYFPDENHWVLKPRNSLQWHDTVLAWLRRWTATP